MTQDGDITQKTLREMTRGLQEDRFTDKWQFVKGRLRQAMSGMELVKSNLEDAKASAPTSVTGMDDALRAWQNLSQILDRLIDSIPAQ